MLSAKCRPLCSCLVVLITGLKYIINVFFVEVWISHKRPFLSQFNKCIAIQPEDSHRHRHRF